MAVVQDNAPPAWRPWHADATNISGWPTMVEPLTLLVDRLQTPIGELLIVADNAGKLRTIDWTDHEARMRQLLDRYYGKGGYGLRSARDPGGLTSAMRDYFKGDIGAIAACRSTTPSERRSREASGGRCARSRAARPSAMPSWRGASASPGRCAPPASPTAEPGQLVVPCHRVIGSNGTLTGYGGGLPRKKWLWSTKAPWRDDRIWVTIALIERGAHLMRYGFYLPTRARQPRVPTSSGWRAKASGWACTRR